MYSKIMLFAFVVLAATRGFSGGNELLVASAEGKLPKVKYEIEYDRTDIDFSTTHGLTAVYYALWNDHCNVADYLIKHRANLEQTNNWDRVTARQLLSSHCLYLDAPVN